MKRYYLDTSIWLDFFENRNWPNLPKSEYAEKFISMVTAKDEKVVYSDVVKEEIVRQGYTQWEVEAWFESISELLLYVEAGSKQFSRAKDLAAKRKLPLFDAVHALLARDNKCIVITRDKHFMKLKDIAESKKPEDVNGT